MIFFAVLVQSNEDDALACVGGQVEFREVWRFGGVSDGVHIFFFNGWLLTICGVVYSWCVYC